jgi:hypothetical protein
MADNGMIEIKGLDERIKQLGEAQTKNPMMQRRIREAIKQVLGRVRSELQKDAQSGLQMDGDPRKAYKAVRYAVYRRLLGGQVNILQSRRAGAMRLYEPQRTLQQGQRGGNRRRRTQRTIDLMSYQGADRGFVLRFLNAGTTDRKTRYGSRGAIAPRNWFGNASQTRLKDAAQQLDRIIDDVIKGVMY